MLKKSSVLGFAVSLLCLLSTAGCVAETVSTEEASEEAGGSLRSRGDSPTNEVEARGTSAGKPNLGPTVVQLAPRVDPGLDPSGQVMGDPQPQPWTEPKKRAPISDGR